MKIGLLQTACVLGDRKENLTSAKKLFDDAVRKGAEFLVFPELFYEGYDLKSYTPENADETAKLNLEMLEIFRAMCKDSSVYAVVPFVEKDGSKLYNALVLIDAKGNIQCKYRKMHLWDADKSCFHDGDLGPCIVDTPFGRLALMICYDIDFPEMARYAAVKGAEIIILPSAWDYIHKDLWEIFLSARAADNMIFVCGVNLFEKTETGYLFGNSRIVNPRGTVVAQLPVHEGGVLVYEIDTKDVYDYRKRFPYLEDRRTRFLKDI
jgi:predicted amidohydrolase